MAELIVLRLVHILGGIFWVGTGLFMTFFLGPVLSKAGPPAGQIMGAMQQRKLFTVLPTVAVLTILSGLRLMWLTSGGFSREYFASTMGATFAAAGAAAIIAFLISLLVVRPAAVRMSTAAGGDAGVDMAHLGKRIGLFSMIATVLLLFAATGMAVARYLG